MDRYALDPGLSVTIVYLRQTSRQEKSHNIFYAYCKQQPLAVLTETSNMLKDRLSILDQRSVTASKIKKRITARDACCFDSPNDHGMITTLVNFADAALDICQRSFEARDPINAGSMIDILEFV